MENHKRSIQATASSVTRECSKATSISKQAVNRNSLGTSTFLIANGQAPRKSKPWDQASLDHADLERRILEINLLRPCFKLSLRSCIDDPSESPVIIDCRHRTRQPHHIRKNEKAWIRVKICRIPYSTVWEHRMSVLCRRRIYSFAHSVVWQIINNQRSKG
jgi:hypothetical protein